MTAAVAEERGAVTAGRRVPGGRRAWGRRAALLALALVLAGCRGREISRPDLRLDLTVTPSPPAVGPAAIVVTLQTSAGTPVAGARLQMEGAMSHAGMPPVQIPLDDRGGGRYIADGFTFTMAGDWSLMVSGVLADGTPVRQRFDVKGVGNGR